MRGVCWMTPTAIPKLHAVSTVETIVTRRRPGANSGRSPGRRNPPSRRLRSHTGDSGRNGRTSMSGIAGISPHSSVYRQAS